MSCVSAIVEKKKNRSIKNYGRKREAKRGGAKKGRWKWNISCFHSRLNLQVHTRYSKRCSSLTSLDGQWTYLEVDIHLRKRQKFFVHPVFPSKLESRKNICTLNFWHARTNWLLWLVLKNESAYRVYQTWTNKFPKETAEKHLYRLDCSVSKTLTKSCRFLTSVKISSNLMSSLCDPI